MNQRRHHCEKRPRKVYAGPDAPITEKEGMKTRSIPMSAMRRKVRNKFMPHATLIEVRSIGEIERIMNDQPNGRNEA